MKFWCAVFFVVLGSLAVTPGAQATTVTFSYNGSNSLDGADHSSGSGSFSFNPTSGPVSLADLTAFSFSWCTDSCATFAIGLSDLTSFTLSSGTSPSASISFQSGFVNDTSGHSFFPEEFGLTGSMLGATGEVDVDNQIIGAQPVDNGPVNLSSDGIISAVPEPLSLSLFSAGLVGAIATRRRRKADKTA